MNYLSKVKDFFRRNSWITVNLTLKKSYNILKNLTGYLLKKSRLNSWPIILKIDISPLCNLNCTVCVHAKPNGNEKLDNQVFNRKQLMSVSQYQQIINQAKGKVSAVSLYYLGDPIIHPDLVEMCLLTKKAKINVHISTNFSFSLSDEKIQNLVTSGITHFTVCVDGISQDKYELTRVGGKVDRVMDNLTRLCKYRDEYKVNDLSIEVQYIKFRHNIDEFSKAKILFKKIGVDQITSFWGSLGNYTDTDPKQNESNIPRSKGLVPRCMWPYVYMLIKYNGDVIPCCNFRLGQQYTKQKSVILGNVFESSVENIWKSKKYAELRKLVSNPNKIKSNEEMKKSFCYGCPSLFKNSIPEKYINGKDHNFEDIYTLNKKGKPHRKAEGVF
ncbi:hypothetical protein DIS18_13415 [Algibacter marinivivus]|uniref:Radical SAM protein n=1 Tax=Algibacter marinivivus TaxID=2100723 RepID=A0A2U2X1L4_9FLAO|nr:radical SAM protein [Algibacter marinivivus]PWH81675.1 hypothetical protein DIS18_13415 [Algibacter marinivivus]